MRRRFAIIPRAIRTVFRKKSYWLVALLGAVLVAAISLLVPAWVIPSNSLSFELSLMTRESFAVLALLAIASGILLSLNVYSFRLQRETLLQAGQGGIGALAAVIGGLVSTSCGCGIGLLVGVVGLGVGTSTFIIANELWIQIAALAIVLVGLYYAARSIVGSARIISPK